MHNHVSNPKRHTVISKETTSSHWQPSEVSTRQATAEELARFEQLQQVRTLRKAKRPMVFGW
jgi:hypothetical protein